jgi:DNA repair exonuclease SbcCD ATPase subunit
VQIGPFTLELATAARTGEVSGKWALDDWDPLQDRASDDQLLPRVTVEAGKEVMGRSRMNRVLMLVGSSPSCKVRLRDPRVSRYHCALLRTPQGVWAIDLLHGTGSCLNGQSLPWALMKDGDALQVGPYVLRVRYPEGCPETPPAHLVEVPAVDASASGERRPSGQNGLARAAVGVNALQAELDQAHERLRDAEVLRQQLADAQADCDRLRKQAQALEVHAAGVADVQPRPEAAEASARELEAVRGERDRWQAEVQNLQVRLTSNVVDQEQIRRLAADLHAAQLEQDRLQTELHSAEQARTRLIELERALTEATAAHESALAAARGSWESERQSLVTDFERERQTHHGAVQATLSDFQARAADEGAKWQQQLEAAQKQLVEEREAVLAAAARLDQESATLERVRADLEARNAEHGEALQRLQEAQDELALSREKARSLQAGLDQALEHQRDIETLGQQLEHTRAEHSQLCVSVQELEGRANAADRLCTQLRNAGAETEQLRAQLQAAESRRAELEAVRADCDRLREQARALETQAAVVTDLQSRLEAAETSARELDAVRCERDRWQAEVRNQQARLASNGADQEQLRRLAADLQAAEMERDGLQTELRSAEQARTRLIELERALTEATAAHESALAAARGSWESERQSLAANLERERQTHQETVETLVRDLRTRIATEGAKWRQQFEAAQRQLVEDRGLFQAQNEQLRQQAGSLQAERDRLLAQLTQAELRVRSAAEHSAAELQQLQQQAARDHVFVQLAANRR